MKKNFLITLYAMASIILLSGIANAEKPANRIFIINQDGKIVEFFKKPLTLVKESENIPTYKNMEMAEPLKLKTPCFNITDFIKPEPEINDIEIDLNNVFHQIEASEAQTK